MIECVVKMEMPKDCWDCPCVNGEYGYCQADENERQLGYPNGRPSWCPIICSLPEGHGRLIDASYVIDVMQDELDNDVPITVDDCFQIECKIPTIVPADTAERSET